MSNISLWVGIIGGLVGILGALFGVVAWWSASVRKRYAAQRDFEHLKNNYATMSKALSEIDRDLDEMRQTLSAVHTLTMHLPELKAYVLARMPDTQGWMQK